MLAQIIAWLTVVMGASIMYLAGKAQYRRIAWYLGVLNQVVWGALAYTTRTWGLFGGCILYGFVYIRNIMRGD